VQADLNFKPVSSEKLQDQEVAEDGQVDESLNTKEIKGGDKEIIEEWGNVL